MPVSPNHASASRCRLSPASPYSTSARARAPVPIAQAVPLALVRSHSRSAASRARSTWPLRDAASANSASAQDDVAISSAMAALRAASRACSYWPRPLWRIAIA